LLYFCFKIFKIHIKIKPEGRALMKRLLACRKYLYTVKRLYVENAFLAASRCLAPDIHSTYFFFASVEKCITG